MIAALSHFLTSIIHLLIPCLNERTQNHTLLLYIGLYEAVSLLTGTHTIAPAQNHLLTSTAVRGTTLPHHIEETTSENAP